MSVLLEQNRQSKNESTSENIDSLYEVFTPIFHAQPPVSLLNGKWIHCLYMCECARVVCACLV